METFQLLVTGVIVLASFLGALVAVLIGQFLAYYRNQRKNIERLYVLVKSLNYRSENGHSVPKNEEKLERIQEDLRKLHLKNTWWMSDKLSNKMDDLQESLSNVQNSVTELEVATVLDMLDNVENGDLDKVILEHKLGTSEHIVDSMLNGDGEQRYSLAKKVLEGKEKTTENLIYGVEEIADDIEKSFYRVPLLRFIPRYIGILN